MAFLNYKTLAVAVSSMGLAGTAYGAGLDRSGQDVTAFLQDGTYAEAVYTFVSADVSGHDNGATRGASEEANYVKGKATGGISEDYDFFRFGVKADVNDSFSVGVIYDEPFGASVKHFGDSNFNAQGGDVAVQALTNRGMSNLETAKARLGQAKVTIQTLEPIVKGPNPPPAAVAGYATANAIAQQLGGAINIAETAEKQKGEGTNVEIRTQNATVLAGAKFGANKNFQVYGGPALQRLTGEVHLRGTAYQGATGYDAHLSPDTALGWVAGVAYSKPEIALKASLTYRSNITHKTKIAEVFPATGYSDTKDFEVTLPESYNLDFQTGVSPTMLLTAKARYVPWGSFEIRPNEYTRLSNTPIIAYAKDQWSGELGLAKKLNDKLVVSGNVGYDSGAGNPVSTLGPVEGYYSVGLGARYNVTKEWSVSAGAKYLMFGDATANLPNGLTAGKFENNDGVIAGVKLAYHSK